MRNERREGAVALGTVGNAYKYIKFEGGRLREVRKTR